MKVHLTIIGLFVSMLLHAQPNAGSATSYSDLANRKRAKIHDPQFDRIDYYYKDNLLRSTVQHSSSGGFTRTWRYFYEKDGADALINQLKAKHPHKQLFGATQLNIRNKVFYEIIMEDKKKWYVYQADSLGNISLKRKFRKR